MLWGFYPNFMPFFWNWIWDFFSKGILASVLCAQIFTMSKPLPPVHSFCSHLQSHLVSCLTSLNFLTSCVLHHLFIILLFCTHLMGVLCYNTCALPQIILSWVTQFWLSGSHCSWENQRSIVGGTNKESNICKYFME